MSENGQVSDAILFVEIRAREWNERVTSTESTLICEGSSFASDELLPGGMEIARLAWRTLSAGAEPLILLGDVGRLTKGGVYYRPFMVLGRTALVGGAKAHYIMSADDVSERRLRALRLLKREIEDVRRMEKDLAKSLPELGQVESTNALLEECNDEIVVLGGNPREVVTDTRLVELSAQHLGGALRDPVFSALTIWRNGSAAAHAQALLWDMPISHQGEAYQLAASASIPAGILDLGWGLWNELRFCDME